MSRRYKSATMKFGVPLAVPGSRYVERCCAKHGQAYGHTPPRDSAIELILINSLRQLLTAPGYFPDGRCTSLTLRPMRWRPTAASAQRLRA